MSHLFVFDNRPTVKNARLLLPAGENIPHTLPLRSARNPQPLLSHPLDLIIGPVLGNPIRNVSPQGDIHIRKTFIGSPPIYTDIEDLTGPIPHGHGILSSTAINIKILDDCGYADDEIRAKQHLAAVLAELLKTPDALTGSHYTPAGPQTIISNCKLHGKDKDLREDFTDCRLHVRITANAGPGSGVGINHDYANAYAGSSVSQPPLYCAIGLPARATITIPFTLSAFYRCAVEIDITSDGTHPFCSPALNLVPNILLLTANGHWKNAPITPDITFDTQDVTPIIDRPLNWQRMDYPEFAQVPERSITTTGTVALQIPDSRLFALAVLPTASNLIPWATNHLPTTSHPASPTNRRIAFADLDLRLELTLHPSRFTLSP